MDHRAYVGIKHQFDEIGRLQLEVLIAQGLQLGHKLLDVGCGCLRGGKHLIPYLDEGCYYGIEPNKELLEAGLKDELGEGLLESKDPAFNHNAKFDLTCFGIPFDFILAHSIFIHACADQVSGCLASASKSLTDGGLLVATFIEGRNNTQGAWSYPGVVAYRSQLLAQLCRAAGLFYKPVDIWHPCNHKWFAAGENTRRGAKILMKTATRGVLETQ